MKINKKLKVSSVSATLAFLGSTPAAAQYVWTGEGSTWMQTQQSAISVAETTVKNEARRQCVKDGGNPRSHQASTSWNGCRSKANNGGIVVYKCNVTVSMPCFSN